MAVETVVERDYTLRYYFRSHHSNNHTGIPGKT
jgi:hypothetical protein